MMRSCLPASRRLAGLAFLLLAAGCDQPEIKEYTVKRIAATAGEDRSASEPTRLLGAIFQREGASWFFKLSGPADVVKQLDEPFHNFVRSVRFTNMADKPITWTVPEDWKPSKGNQFTYAAFSVGPENNRLELTVSRAGGDLLQNINRWRGQIGLGELSPAQLAAETKQIDVNGAKATLVDFLGKKRGGGMPPFAGGKKRPPMIPPGHAAGKPVFTKPDGWKEAPLKIFSIATFQVVEGRQSAEITITPLGGPAGGLLGNINRWRTQVGLGPSTEAQLAKDTKVIDIGGAQGQLVDLKGDAKRIIGAVVVRGGQSWFFKMMGDTDLVGKQRGTFETFLKSVRFEEAGNE